QARFHNRAVNGRTLYVPGLAAIAGLADLPDQSCRWYRGSRPLRAADDNVPAALLPCDSASRASTVGIVRGDDKSDGGVDFAPDHWRRKCPLTAGPFNAGVGRKSESVDRPPVHY